MQPGPLLRSSSSFPDGFCLDTALDRVFYLGCDRALLSSLFSLFAYLVVASFRLFSILFWPLFAKQGGGWYMGARWVPKFDLQTRTRIVYEVRKREDANSSAIAWEKGIKFQRLAGTAGKRPTTAPERKHGGLPIQAASSGQAHQRPGFCCFPCDQMRRTRYRACQSTLLDRTKIRYSMLGKMHGADLSTRVSHPTDRADFQHGQGS